MDLIEILNSFALRHPWIPLAITIYLLVVKAIVGIRDSIDKTPEEDNGWFERFATILKKTLGYLGGVRPSAPKGAVVAPGETKDAIGVKTVVK